MAEALVHSLSEGNPDLSVSRHVIVEAEGASMAPGVRDRSALLGAVADRSVDLAVLSSRDVPEQLPAGLVSRVILARREPRTVALTSGPVATPLRDLPAGSAVLCGSERERALLNALYPGLRARLVSQGPATDAAVEGALDSVRSGSAAAFVLPAWEWEVQESRGLSPELLPRTVWIPAPGEGGTSAVFALENQEAASALGGLQDPATVGEVLAEMAFANGVEAGPDVVVAATGLSYGPGLRLWGLLLDREARRAVKVDRTGTLDSPEPLGWALAADAVYRSAEVLT